MLSLQPNEFVNKVILTRIDVVRPFKLVNTTALYLDGHISQNTTKVENNDGNMSLVGWLVEPQLAVVISRYWFSLYLL